VIGRDAEAALHRVSAAACFAKSGDLSRAANLYRAALAGPLSDAATADVKWKLSACLKQIVMKTVRLQDFKPSKATVEKSEIETVVGEFRHFLEAAVDCATKDQTIMVQIR